MGELKVSAKGLTWRDGVATAVVAAIVSLYTWQQLAGPAPLVAGVRGMAALGLVFGFAACVIGVQAPAERMSGFGITLALATTTAGVLALVTASSLALAAFIVLIVFLWATTTARHAGWVGTRGPQPDVARTEPRR